MKNFTKSLFAAIMLLAGVTTVSAQVDNTFRFVDEEGKEIPDGGTYYSLAELIDKMPDFPGMVMSLEAPFDIYVENTTGETAYVSAEIITKSKASGALSVCFPSQCENNVPSKYETSTGIIAAGSKLSLNSEWLPEKGKYGEAEFTIQLRVMNATLNNLGMPTGYTFKANGPKITVKCLYADPTGIDDVATGGVKTYNVYNAAGRAVVTGGGAADVEALGKGLYVVETLAGGKRVATKKIVK